VEIGRPRCEAPQNRAFDFADVGAVAGDQRVP
jgi:hypothetical protein